MNGTPEDPKNPARAAEILGQLGLELAFVEPGQDKGLLPINSFLMDLEELVQSGAPAAVAAGLAAARRWLDVTLDGSGKFSSETIRDLTAWHAWMSTALGAWHRGTDQPEVPAAWVRPGGPVRAPVLTKTATPPPPPPATASDAEEPAIRLDLAADSEVLIEFHSEAQELLQKIEQGVLLLEENPAEAGTINSVFRAFHTFKGAPAFCTWTPSATWPMTWSRSSMRRGARS